MTGDGTPTAIAAQQENPSAQGGVNRMHGTCPSLLVRSAPYDDCPPREPLVPVASSAKEKKKKIMEP